MDGTFGTEAQRRLQRQSEAEAPVIDTTPGLVHSGRGVTCDDIDALGWDAINRHLDADGMVVFRWMDAPARARLEEAWAGTDVTLYSWDGFRGEAQPIREAIAPTLARALPGGIRRAEPDATLLPRMQAFLAEMGIAPLSTAALGGTLYPARASILMRDDAILACGWAAMMHPPHSALARLAWIGLLAVAPEARGQALGLQVCARTLDQAVATLGADGAIGFAADDNAPSKAMLARCGMTVRPFKSVVAVRGGARPSR